MTDKLLNRTTTKIEQILILHLRPEMHVLKSLLELIKTYKIHYKTGYHYGNISFNPIASEHDVITPGTRTECHVHTHA